MIKISVSKAKELIPTALRSGLVPMLHGSPGLGKSAVVHQIAKQYKLKLIDLRLSQCDPTDLMGFPFMKNGRSGYAPMEAFPLDVDPIPTGYTGWLLFLDELTSAPQAVQAAAYKLILDRMVGLHKLHSNVAIVAAGNLETDGAIVNPMSTALASRLMHLFVELNAKEWLSWAMENQMDHRLTSFVEFRPDKLYTFSPTNPDMAYACPRTWESSDKLMKHVDINRDTLPMFAGLLSEGVSRELLGFCQASANLPRIEQILQSPRTMAVPGEPSYQYALIGAIAANTTEENCSSLMEYIKRMPAEFQVVGLRSMIKRNKTLLGIPAITNWVTETSAELL